MSDVDYDALASKHGGEQNYDAIAAMHGAVVDDEPGSKAALMISAGAKAVPVAAKAGAEFATNPNVPRLFASAGRTIGGVAPVVTGAIEGGPVGALVGVAAASKGAWAGGKTGWFGGKLAQKVAAPVANALEKMTPIADAVSRVAGPQALLDLAQMSEPNRKDIGFLGVGGGGEIPKDRLEAIYAEAVANGIKSGLTPSSSAARFANGDLQKFSAAMAAYMKSRMVK